mmetsp:Transcript_58326/g.65227  ORF Transcript_58326/g.65227 Transcript_58326/m.65227 type:complete len:138 (-) Transcript_58326:96-509(-)
MSSPEGLQEQLSYYLRFVETVLKPRLETAESAANIIREEIANYEELRNNKEPIDESIMVDIGHKTIFCNAKVREPNRIFLHVGMGFHVEFTHSEACEFGKKRISFLRATKLKEKEIEIEEIKEHIQSTTIVLDQLYV